MREGLLSLLVSCRPVTSWRSWCPVAQARLRGSTPQVPAWWDVMLHIGHGAHGFPLNVLFVVGIVGERGEVYSRCRGCSGSGAFGLCILVMLVIWIDVLCPETPSAAYYRMPHALRR